MTIRGTGVADLIVARSAKPSAVIPIPMDAITRASIRSDNFPAYGDTNAITTGCAINTIPAAIGVISCKYWRYKLIITTLEKVAVYIITAAKHELENTLLV